MSQRRQRPSRGLVMPAGRRIPRTTAPPRRRPPPEGPDEAAPPVVTKAAGDLSELAARIHSCTACERTAAPRAYGTGSAPAAVLFLKDRPSGADLETTNAFASEAEALEKAFAALGIPLAWVYAGTAVRCGDGEATPSQIEACSVHLLTEVEAVRPKVIVAFGEGAAAAVRALDGRCGIAVPEELPPGEPTRIRGDLVVVVTEPLPQGVQDKASKQRLWRVLQRLPGLIG